jgi:hypothetical protein
MCEGFLSTLAYSSASALWSSAQLIMLFNTHVQSIDFSFYQQQQPCTVEQCLTY